MIPLQLLVRERASDGRAVWLSLGDDVFLRSLCEGVCLYCVYGNLPAALVLSYWSLWLLCAGELFTRTVRQSSKPVQPGNI